MYHDHYFYLGIWCQVINGFADVTLSIISKTICWILILIFVLKNFSSQIQFGIDWTAILLHELLHLSQISFLKKQMMGFPSYYMSLNYLEVSLSTVFSLHHNLNQILLPLSVTHDILKDLQLLKVDMLMYLTTYLIHPFQLIYEIRYCHFIRPSVFFKLFICLKSCLCFIF